MSATRLFVALIIFSCSRGVLTKTEGFYTIVVPGTIRSESVLHLSIGLNDFSQSCWFKISLKSFNNKNEYTYYELQTVEVQPNTIKLVELRVPTLNSKRGRLEINGFRGIISNDIAAINIEHDSHSVFIQTNKAKYKPGELIQFRVICVDQLTRPAQINQGISVFIYDSEENVIKLLSDVKLVQGVFRGEFQLSEYTVLGEWKIKVEVGGNAAAEKNVLVAKYVLPKFMVKISTKQHVAIDEDKIVLTISANYFYGEPVKGIVNLILKSTYAAFHDHPAVYEKASQISENTTLTVNMKTDLNIRNRAKDGGSLFLYKFNLKAVVIDEITEQQSSSDVEVIVHSQPIKIRLYAPKVFDSDTIIKLAVKVSVTDLENKPVQGSTVKIVAECENSSDTLGFGVVTTEFAHEMGNKNANILQIENQNFSICQLYAEYEGIRSRREKVRKNEDTFYLDVLTESPEVGKELQIKLKSLDPIENFSYEVVSRGDIIYTEHINVQGNETTYIFGFNVTYQMVPKITIYAHRVKERIFSGQLKDVYIKRAFQNSIEIIADDETKPGSPVHINVTTDESSYVGLMGLDHRILQNTFETDDLTEDHFYTKLRNYDALSIDTSPFPGSKAGLITFSNSFTKVGSRFGDDGFLIDGFQVIVSEDAENLPELFDRPILELPRIRKLFSESWLYKDFEKTPAGGLNLLETIPDTITSWAITGFSLNPKTGLTLTKNATNLKVFQEFFVSIDLPGLVTEGETIEVPIYISNYLKEDALTNITIEKDSDNIEIFKRPEVPLKSKEPISKKVPANRRAKITIFIKPLKSGQYNLTVKALTPTASDAVQKVLKVKSEGVPYAISKTYLIHFEEESLQEDEIAVDIPEYAVPGSQRVEISIVGDIFRPLLRSLQKMESVSFENGEDNMRFLISNLMVLKYLKALNYTSPSLESKIRLYLELGYQNQLCFKHLDGSFGRFNRAMERSGDVWQTAFSLWGLKQSKNFIDIDSKVFERGLAYLKTRQHANGCFKSRYGIEEDIEYTAFSVMVFLMDDHWRTVHTQVITKGLTYLYEMSDSLDHKSSISVFSTYILLLGRHEKAGDCFEKLTKNSVLTSRKMLWKKTDTLQSHLETTANCLMNLFECEKKPRESLLHIVRGLMASESGKTSLTQMIALHAMLVFIEDLNMSRKNLTVFFKDDQKGSGYFPVNTDNSQVLQTVQLSDKTRKINLQSKGHGFAVVDVKYKYNLLLENQSSSIYATNITTQRSASSLSVFKVCASALRNSTENSLTVMEVNLQSGYMFTPKVASDIGLTWKFESIKVNDSLEKLVAYIANIDRKGVCLKLESLEKYKVLNAKPGSVVLYDTDTKDEKTAKSFKINDS